MGTAKFAKRPKMEERIIFVVPAELKRGLCEVAASRGRTAADLAREALASIIAAALNEVVH